MSDGDRVLTEEEWEVFSTGLDQLRDDIESDIEAEADDAITGISAFDRLTSEQKLAILAEVATALRNPEVPTPAHTAANEGTIMAVMAASRDMLRAEIDFGEPEDTALRKDLLAAVHNPEGRPGRLPAPTSKDWEAWGNAFQILLDRIFWDDDFELEDEFLDLPSEEARAKLEFFGIDPDYYLTVPDEPGERGLIAARQVLARLLGLHIPDDDGLFSALHDLYHDLIIGPVSKEDLGAWDGKPWIEANGLPHPEWDCDLARWRSEFAGAVPEEPFRIQPADHGVDHDLPDGIRVEASGEVWVVREDGGWYWCGLVENGWTNSLNDEGMLALTFPSEVDARVAYAQADRMYCERSDRREAALVQLGISG